MRYFEWRLFEKFVMDAVPHYRETAPAVSNFVDAIYILLQEYPEQVSVYTLMQIQRLYSEGEWEAPDYAANRIYKLSVALGMDTTAMLDH